MAKIARGILLSGDRFKRDGQLTIEEMHTYAKAEQCEFVTWLQKGYVKDNGLKEKRFFLFDEDRNGQLDGEELEWAVAQWRLEKGDVDFIIFPEHQQMFEPEEEEEEEEVEKEVM